MSKKKPQKSEPVGKGKVCLQCNGEGAVAEMCSDCQGHGCFECDGQGYIAWECDTCGDPENRRSPVAAKEQQRANSASSQYPSVLGPGKVGKYGIFCNSGGGILFKAVLEYRVWVHGTRGSDTCRFFGTYESAKEFSAGKRGAEAPLVLVLQNPWIRWNEEKRDFELVHEDRVAEWQVEWLIAENRSENAEAVIAKLRMEYPNGCSE